uniref:LigA n=1 Tax=Parastrongyloides trichosuri TaxID=131310 RepID=A0A0N4Z8C8_PARTI
MIGRLVQHQQVRRRQFQPRQPQARLLSAAQVRRAPVQRQVSQTDLGQSCLHPLFQRPVRLGHVVQRTVARQHAMQNRQTPGDAQRIGDGLAVGRGRGLRQPADGSDARDRALGGLSQTGDQAQQRGLAHAVSSHDGRAFAPEGERQIVEEASAVRRAGRDAVERHECGCGPVWAWVEYEPSTRPFRASWRNRLEPCDPRRRSPASVHRFRPEIRWFCGTAPAWAQAEWRRRSCREAWEVGP